MKRNAMLAVDMGASNGRVVWGQWHESGLNAGKFIASTMCPFSETG